MEPFVITEGKSPLITAAIHEGHAIRQELLPYLGLEEHERSREEDPYTDYLTEISGSRVIVNVSRFETDVNRPREKAVYQRPEDAWELNVWKKKLPPAIIERSLQAYDAFYTAMGRFLEGVIERFGCFAVLDLHTYNYRREAANSETANSETANNEPGNSEPGNSEPGNSKAVNGEPQAAGELENPEINIGTAHNLPRWNPLIQRFINTLSGAIINEKSPDVRENIKFKGGEFSRWINRHYGNYGFVLSIELKKTFMDELTGIVDIYHLRDIRRALSFTADELLEQLAMNRAS